MNTTFSRDRRAVLRRQLVDARADLMRAKGRAKRAQDDAWRVAVEIELKARPTDDPVLNDVRERLRVADDEVRRAQARIEAAGRVLAVLDPTTENPQDAAAADQLAREIVGDVEDLLPRLMQARSILRGVARQPYRNRAAFRRLRRLVYLYAPARRALADLLTDATT